jgi:antitoxin component of RelBE/YafQ-DinJ toxin-antitoxin module
VPVVPISARNGTGISELRAEIARRAAEKQSIRARIDGDLRAVAARMSQVSGDAPTRVLPPERVDALDDAFAEAAGVPTIVASVERRTRQRVGRATAWPVVSWVSGIRPDPARRLELDLGEDADRLTGRANDAAPQRAQVQRARVDTEVRELADDVSSGLGAPWVEAVRRASVSRLDDLGERLDAALASVAVHADRLPGWAGLVRVLQWLLLLAGVVGLVWTGVLLGSGGVGDPDAPQVGGVALALVLLVGGLALGIVLGLVARLGVARAARRRAADADQRLRAAVAEVSHELVVDPVEIELAAYATVRTSLDRALG